MSRRTALVEGIIAVNIVLQSTLHSCKLNLAQNHHTLKPYPTVMGPVALMREEVATNVLLP
jgi:hypothetical protein